MNLKKMIIVGMADIKIAKEPDVLTTLGLGSCVGISIYDPTTKIIGMAHCMLPDSTQIQNNDNVAKFVDTALMRMVNDMVRLGANKRMLKAKIAGGAQMFAFNSTNESMRIGDRNIEATVKHLRQLGIPIIARDTGLNYGRTIEFYSSDGSLLIKTIGHGNKVI